MVDARQFLKDIDINLELFYQSIEINFDNNDNTITLS